MKFITIGDGRLMGELKYSAQKMGIEENFIFTGYRTDAQAILSLATVVTFPSLKEGLPLAMLLAACAANGCAKSRWQPLLPGGNHSIIN